MNELLDLSLRLIVLVHRLENEDVPPDLLSILGDKTVLQYGEQELDHHVRLLPDVVPADGLFDNEGRFLPMRAGDAESAETVLAALTRMFLSFAEELCRFVPLKARLLHTVCLILMCRGDWSVKSDCLDIFRVLHTQRLTLSRKQLLLEVNLTVQVFEATLVPADSTPVEECAALELVQSSFFALLNTYTALPVASTELCCLQAAISKLTEESRSSDIDRLKLSHQKILTKLLVHLHHQQRRVEGNNLPESLLKKSIQLGLVDEVEELVWEEVAATLHHKEPPRVRKRKADSEFTDVVIDLTEGKLWTVCCSTFQQRITEDTESVLALFTVAKKLVKRILLKWPLSAVVAFDSAGLSFLVCLLEQMVAGAATCPRGQERLLSVARDLALLLHSSRAPEAEKGEDISQLLVGIASRPWLLTSGLKVSDLRLGRWQQLFTNNPLSDVDDQVVGGSLHILSLFRKEICPKWRLSVMKHCLKIHGEKIVW